MQTTAHAARLARRKKQFALPESMMGSVTCLPTGHSYQLKFTRKRHLSAQLFDNFGNEPVANAEYRIKGDKGASFQGKTDAEGKLRHEDVPKEKYRLELEWEGQSYACGLPWVHDPEKPVQQRIRNLGLYKLHVQIMDGQGRKPVPDVPYRVRGEGLRTQGKTDAEGRLLHPGVACAVYTIVLRPVGEQKDYLTRVPSVGLGDEPLEQRVLGLSAEARDDQPRHLRAILFDHFGEQPLKNLAYAIRTSEGEELAGTTGPDGKLEHQNVSEADHVVEVEDAEAGVKLRTTIPWVHGDQVIEQRVRGHGVGMLHVQLFDERGHRPLSGRECRVFNERGFKVRMRSDARGMIGPVEAPSGILTVYVGVDGGKFAKTRVPTVDLGGEPIEQRVRGAR